MKSPGAKTLSRIARRCIAVLCAVALMPDASCTMAQEQKPAASPQAAQSPQQGAEQKPAAKIPSDQLDSLVAPIALYPDPLLAQILAASTYPLEIIQLQ